MKIIKYGVPENCLHFICKECGCEWIAHKTEASEIPDMLLETNEDKYVMTCPDCSNGFCYPIKRVVVWKY